MGRDEVKQFLEEKYLLYNKIDFIKDDPISIPHRFSLKQDIEIAGFFAATFAWGQRITTIHKCLELFERMDNAPYDFVCHHQETDLKRLLKFVHRTFNDTDLLYFIYFLKHHYKLYPSLESAFFIPIHSVPINIEPYLIHFHKYFFSLPEAPQRTRKHVSTPEGNSSCKRLCMYLRWMVRKDKQGVDLGIWQNIKPAQLICPIDVHVERVARALELIDDRKANWKSAVHLTEALKTFDEQDPVRFDYALFGPGVIEKMRTL